MIHISFTRYSPEELNCFHKNVGAYLGEHEQAEYDHFRVPKRKDEFIASRIAMKDLVSAHSPALKNLGSNEIQIIKEPSGVPYLIRNVNERLPGWISISHSHGYIFSAYSPDEIRFGVDVEHIETRAEEFLMDYFSMPEQEKIMALGNDNNAFVTTLAWSAKESVLKACGIGLGVDTRMLETEISTGSLPVNGWDRMMVKSSAIDIPSTQVFWTHRREFVLTVCVLDSPDPELVWEQSGIYSASGR